jgi:hypothetical protein
VASLLKADLVLIDLLDVSKLGNCELQPHLDGRGWIFHIVDNHVQEDLVLVYLAFQLFDLLLAISGGHPEFVDLLGQIYLNKLLA